MLHALYSAFDAACRRHGVTKITTIGDAFIAVDSPLLSGARAKARAKAATKTTTKGAKGAKGEGRAEAAADGRDQDDGGGRAHPPARAAATNVVRLACALVGAAGDLRAKTGWPVHIRLGVHTGSVLAGTLGNKQYAYLLWGPGLKKAMEQEGGSESGRVRVSASTLRALQQEWGGGRRPASRREEDGGDGGDGGGGEAAAPEEDCFVRAVTPRSKARKLQQHQQEGGEAAEDARRPARRSAVLVGLEEKLQHEFSFQEMERECGE